MRPRLRRLRAVAGIPARGTFRPRRTRASGGAGIGAAIADAWAKRKDVPRKVEALTSADGELQATRHWVGRAQACGYLDGARHREIEERCDAIGRMLGTMIRDAGKFSGGARPSGRAEPDEPAPDAPPRPPAARPSPTYRSYPPRRDPRSRET